MNPWCPIAALVASLYADAGDSTRDLMRRVIANYESSQKRMGRMLYTQTVSRRELDSAGKETAHRTFRMRREEMDGLPISRLLERDGKPLPPEEIRKQNDAIRKAIDEFRALPPDEQQKRLDGKPGREVEFIREMPEALDYTYLRSHWRDGREVLEFEMRPREGYRAKNMQARVFEKVRGRIFVDKSQAEMAELDAEVFDNVNVGGFLAKIDKGTRFYLTRSDAGNGTWIPDRTLIKFGVKVMIVKTMRQETEILYRDVRPWRSAAAN